MIQWAFMGMYGLLHILFSARMFQVMIDIMGLSAWRSLIKMYPLILLLFLIWKFLRVSVQDH